MSCGIPTPLFLSHHSLALSRAGEVMRRSAVLLAEFRALAASLRPFYLPSQLNARTSGDIVAAVRRVS